MRNSRLIILTALEVEARAAAKGVGIRFRRNCPLKHVSAPIEIHTIGMRAARLARLLPSLDLSSQDRVWMVGLAGALDPALRVGDIVMDAGPSEPILQFADTSIRRGQIHTSDRLVGSPAEKRDLFARTGALAVDMEQQIVSAALAPLGIAVVGIRAISDTADTSLDPVLPSLVGSTGRPRWPALASTLLRRPGLLISLIRLGKDSSRAAEQLTKALGQRVKRENVKT